jgi:hypothetical protein
MPIDMRRTIFSRFKPSDWLAFSALIVSLVALGLSIEARLQERADINVDFENTIIGFFSDQPPDKWAPESLATKATIVNSGKRGVSILDIKCILKIEDESYDLLNASQTIYNDMDLPIDVPGDSAKELWIDWVMGRQGKLEKYDMRLSSLPRDASYELQIHLSNGRSIARTYGYHDLQIIPLEEAQKYRDALGTPIPAR